MCCKQQEEILKAKSGLMLLNNKHKFCIFIFYSLTRKKLMNLMVKVHL